MAAPGPRVKSRSLLALLVAMGTLVAFHGLLAAQQLTLEPGYRQSPMNPLAVNGFFTGGAGILGLVLAAIAVQRRGPVAVGAAAALLGATVPGALLVGGSGPLAQGQGDWALAWFGGTLLWLGFLVPCAVLAAMRVRPVVLAALFGTLALFLVAAAPGLGPGFPADLSQRLDAQPGRILMVAVTHVAFGSLVVAGALSVRGPLAETSARAPLPGLPQGVAPWWTAAAVFALLTWVLAGAAAFLWALPPLLVAMPALLAVRSDARRSALAALGLVAGVLPLLPATFTDSFLEQRASYPGQVALFEAAVRGPRWANPGIDSQVVVDVGLPGFAAGLALLALLAPDWLPWPQRSARTS